MEASIAVRELCSNEYLETSEIRWQAMCYQALTEEHKENRKERWRHISKSVRLLKNGIFIYECVLTEMVYLQLQFLPFFFAREFRQDIHWLPRRQPQGISVQ